MKAATKRRYRGMTQTGRFTQPPQQLFRQALDAAGSSEDIMLYRYAGPCSEPKLTQAAAEVRQADLSLMVRVRFHYDKIKKKIYG